MLDFDRLIERLDTAGSPAVRNTAVAVVPEPDVLTRDAAGLTGGILNLGLGHARSGAAQRPGGDYASRRSGGNVRNATALADGRPVRARIGLTSTRRLTGLTSLVLLLIPLALEPFALRGSDPLFGVLWLAISATLILLHQTLLHGEARSTIGSVAVGAFLMITVGSAVHELLPVFPAVAVSQALLGLLWLLGATTLGGLVVHHVRSTVGWRRASAMTIGTGIATWGLLEPVIMLLRPSTPLAVRLAWFLGEEDHAHFMGIAREVLTLGPQAGQLAAEVGTGFVSPVIVGMRALRLVGGDPRLTAVTVMTASVALLIVMLGAGLLLLQITASYPVDRPSSAQLVVLAVASWSAASIGTAVAVALPMQTGFLSFMWAIGWLTVGVAMSPLLLSSATVAQRLGLLFHIAASVLMLVRSWAFLIGGLVPILIVLMVLSWPRLWPIVRARWYVGTALIIGLGLILLTMFQRSLFRYVLGAGREALLVQASHIYFDELLFRALLFCFAGGVVISLFGPPRTAIRTLLVLGPAASVGLSWIGLWILTQFLVDGEIRYAGIKLAYGGVAVASLVLLSALIGLATREHLIVQAAFTAILMFVLTSSATVGIAENWTGRIAMHEQPHAVSVIDAIEKSSPDLPLRCLPRPGVSVSPGSQWAMYFCVRWIEDAFNADRFHGYRFDFLAADGSDFSSEIAEARASGRYDFARIVLLERGWFGWDGR